MDTISDQAPANEACSRPEELAVFNEAFLQKTIAQKIAGSKTTSLSGYYRRIRDDRAEAEALLRLLHVQYSRFFREPLACAFLEQSVIPALIQRAAPDSEIRVWSSGCAYGQEAYSLAILLDEQIRSAPKPLRYTIFATDVGEEALSFAQRGVYSADDLQNVQLKHVEAYFTHTGNTYAVASRLQRSVCFSRYDMLDSDSQNPPESIFGHFDIVSCCNLMMYYRLEAQLGMLRKLTGSLSGGGTLIVGKTESAFVEKYAGLKAPCLPAPVFQKL